MTHFMRCVLKNNLRNKTNSCSISQTGKNFKHVIERKIKTA